MANKNDNAKGEVELIFYIFMVAGAALVAGPVGFLVAFIASFIIAALKK